MDRSNLRPWLVAVACMACLFSLGARCGSQQPPNHSLRLFGSGYGDIDRVKIPVDDVATTTPGPPADVGAEDFTIEFWMRASAAENTAGPAGCGPSNYWINGNIVVDRDRFNQPRNFGVSIGGGVVHFGVMGEFGGAETLCGQSDVLDDAWHHVAVQRRRADGRMWIFVDGSLEAEGDGPDGDISYPDDGVPGNHCGGPCDFSDPFLVLGAEKHDAGASYPSYSGYLDELRLSSTLRYPSAGYPVPTAPFAPDPDTAALYHFDETLEATVVVDVSGAPGGPSNGFLSVGGSPAGPVRTTLTPFGPDAGTLRFASATSSAAETDGVATIRVSRLGGSEGAVSATWLAVDGSATAPADYVAGWGVVSFADGESGDLSFDVALVDDALVEGNETVLLLLSGPTGGAVLGSPNVATLTITDDESPDPVEVAATVDAADRDAEYYPPVGQELANLYDPLGLCIGRDGGGEFQAGFQFAMDLPQGAQILAATLSLTATDDQSGSPEAQVRAYDVASAAPFDPASSVPLTQHHAQTTAEVTWDLQTFISGQRYDSPDLAALVQAVVDRPDWTALGYLGLVLDGAPSPSGSWRCVANQPSGSAAELRVTYLP